MPNSNLSKAKAAKNDEFYTQYSDIEKEVNVYIEFNPDVFKGKTILCPCDDPEWSNFTKYFAQNFERLGLKKLIGTSYAKDKSLTQGKIFTLTDEEETPIDSTKLKWNYLEGTGDFRSNEIKKLRDESDIIITNPPFSLFREFLAWIVEAKKQFLIIGNMNAITYKKVFPLIKENKMWLGATKCRNFYTVDKMLRSSKSENCYWYTNLIHEKRNPKLSLMTMEDNIKFSKHKKVKGTGYQKYDNYDAIEIPYTDAIPSDYDGVMGVPISFLDKYSPEQFQILGATQRGCHDEVPDIKKYDEYWEIKQNGEKTGSSGGKTNENANLLGNDGKKNYFVNAEGRIIQSAYQRIFIKHQREQNENH